MSTRRASALQAGRVAATRDVLSMSPNENAPVPAEAQVVSLLPLIAGQIYALALVITDHLGYFQFMLLNAADVWLAWLSTLFLFSSGEGVFGKRLRKFLGLNGGLFVALAFAAYAGVASDLELGTRNQPLFRMLDLVSISLSGDLVMKGLIYIAVGL